MLPLLYPQILTQTLEIGQLLYPSYRWGNWGLEKFDPGYPVNEKDGVWTWDVWNQRLYTYLHFYTITLDICKIYVL